MHFHWNSKLLAYGLLVLVCSFRESDCINLLYEVAGEGINKRISSQDALQNKYSYNFRKY